jgi:hypothetical protein
MRESHAHLYVSDFEFDIVTTEIAATLFHVGVPKQEHKEFMDIIESYRSMVVGPPGDKEETASTVMFVNLLALRQRIVPDRLQGRVNATARAVAVSGTPAGALLAGVLVGPLGGVRTVFLALAGFALLNAVLAFFTPLREREPVG